jgi:hypothetical protein
METRLILLSAFVKIINAHPQAPAAPPPRTRPPAHSSCFQFGRGTHRLPYVLLECSTSLYVLTRIRAASPRPRPHTRPHRRPQLAPTRGPVHACSSFESQYADETPIRPSRVSL